MFIEILDPWPGNSPDLNPIVNPSGQAHKLRSPWSADKMRMDLHQSGFGSEADFQLPQWTVAVMSTL